MRTLASSLSAALALLLASAGCAASGVKVRPAGVTAPPRPAGCKVEVIWYKAPDRPFDELADMETHVTLPPTEGAHAVLYAEACRLGADALLVHKSQVLNELGHVLLVATALKYKPAGAEPPAPPAPPAPAQAPLAPQPAPTAGDTPR